MFTKNARSKAVFIKQTLDISNKSHMALKLQYYGFLSLHTVFATSQT